MKMKNRITSYLSIALSIFIIAGCSSGNPTTPNKANLTNLAKTPTAATDNENIKKINLSGRVLDSLTRKPIENASVLIYVIANDEVIKSIKNGTTGIPVPSGSPGLSTPLPINSINPGSDNNPPVIPDAVTTPASPAASVSPDPSTVNPLPFVEENEEKSVKPSPTAKPKKEKKVKPKTEVKSSSSPANTDSADKTDKDKSGKDLDELDIISALTTLKINDLQEFNSTTGNDGKFWINKVPDSNVIITVNAPNYKTVSIFNSDTSKVEDILLQPIENKQYITNVQGMVISATNNPVENATVSSSYVINESFSIPTVTNKIGAFQADDVSVGERTFMAVVKDEAGQIISMGTTDFDVKKGKDSDIKKSAPLKKMEDKTMVQPTPTPAKAGDNSGTKSIFENEEDTKTTVEPTPSPTADKPEASPSPADAKTKAEATPSPSKSKDKNAKTEEEIVPVKLQNKEYPLIKVKAVTDYIDLKGKIKLPEDTTLKNINIYLTFKKKGQPKEEIFLTDKALDVNADTFELSLPKPDFGFYYHLEFVAVNKKGTYIYHHEYNLKKENKEMKVSFMQPLIIGKTDFIEKDGEKLPIFTWVPVEGASFYKVSLDKIDKDNNLTTVWEGITPFNTAIYPISTGSARLNYSNTYNWSVVAVKEEQGKENGGKMQFSKLNITSWSDLSHSPHMAFSPDGDEGTEEIEEIDTEKEKKEGKN